MVLLRVPSDHYKIFKKSVESRLCLKLCKSAHDQHVEMRTEERGRSKLDLSIGIANYVVWLRLRPSVDVGKCLFLHYFGGLL